MKVIKDLPTIPSAQRMVSLNLQEWGSKELSAEEQETIDIGVLRARKRLEDKTRNQYSLEKDQLKFFVENDSSATHAGKLNALLDPVRYKKRKLLLSKALKSRLTNKQQTRIVQILGSKRNCTI